MGGRKLQLMNRTQESGVAGVAGVLGVSLLGSEGDGLGGWKFELVGGAPDS